MQGIVHCNAEPANVSVSVDSIRMVSASAHSLHIEGVKLGTVLLRVQLFKNTAEQTCQSVFIPPISIRPDTVR
jgi:hypothetical protein